MVCLGDRDHSVVSETASKYCSSDSSVDHDGYSISSKGFHGTIDWFQIGKGVRQGCILSPAYLTYMQSTS